ncbi:MAG: electron transporter RnfG [Desulfobacteraceae bacterium IS3]|nr:MAG: electron transporter RnfG [Desulfobacteraceae bacterium IS3]
MRDMIKMVVVLTLLNAFSGGLLAAVRVGTMEKIQYQQLQFIKGPAIKQILSGCSNDPLVDRFAVKDGDVERSFYVGVFEGKPKIVAFESAGKGFGGELGLMIGVNLEDDKLVGVGVTTHKETPGLGSKAKTDVKFGAQFKGMVLKDEVKVAADGGKINAISGATVTSRGVCVGVTQAGALYGRLKAQIAEGVKKFGK